MELTFRDIVDPSGMMVTRVVKIGIHSCGVSEVFGTNNVIDME